MGLKIHNSTVTDTKLEDGARATQELCVVHGAINSSPTSTIHFRLDLPERADWNGNLLMIGGGGFDGFVPTDVPEGTAELVKLLGPDAEQISGFARVSSDSGHQGRGSFPAADFSWVTNNPTALRNHAYEANHTVLKVAMDLSQQFYGSAPKRRYIIGVSNGGRAGLVAIQHYPLDYDGVLAFEPAISQEGFAANVGPQLLQHIFSAPENWLDAAQIALFERSELEACDAQDGLRDGILSNAGACDYVGQNLLCKPGEAGSDQCLTSGQIESIRRIFAEKHVAVTLADGWVGYAPYSHGGESSDWGEYLFGPTFAARAALSYVLVDNVVKWGITADPNASAMTLDPVQSAAQYRALSDAIDATNPDLRAFYAHGGKLIVWHGVADACLSYLQTARYIKSVETVLGDRASREFLRFYTSPATGHALGGAGASTSPLLGALADWVERGRAPGTLQSTLSRESAKPGNTRPLCEFPRYPRYKGKGDPTKASSFECAGDRVDRPPTL